MTSADSINVSFVDNELYIIAIPSNNLSSTELLHYNSGYNDACNITITLNHVLASGEYTLSFIGINWGLAAGFTITLSMSDGSKQSIGMPTEPNAPTGVIFTKNVAITV